jgi:hypothetical protein
MPHACHPDLVRPVTGWLICCSAGHRKPGVHVPSARASCPQLCTTEGRADPGKRLVLPARSPPPPVDLQTPSSHTAITNHAHTGDVQPESWARGTAEWLFLKLGLDIFPIANIPEMTSCHGDPHSSIFHTPAPSSKLQLQATLCCHRAFAHAGFLVWRDPGPSALSPSPVHILYPPLRPGCLVCVLSWEGSYLTHFCHCIFYIRLI